MTIFRRAVGSGLLLITLLLSVACRHSLNTPEPALLAYFPALPPGDTLHLEIAQGDSSIGKTMPNSLFFKIVPQGLLQEIDYLADSSQAVVSGRQQFALNDSVTACWVEIRQFWFQHYSLLLYNKHRKNFTDRVTVAEWYGGDGGQILTGSWLFDFDGDGHKDLVRREIQHSLQPGEAEPVEHVEESATLLLWKNGHFMETPLADTAATIRRFPIRRFW